MTGEQLFHTISDVGRKTIHPYTINNPCIHAFRNRIMDYSVNYTCLCHITRYASKPEIHIASSNYGPRVNINPSSSIYCS